MQFADKCEAVGDWVAFVFDFVFGFYGQQAAVFVFVQAQFGLCGCEKQAVFFGKAADAAVGGFQNLKRRYVRMEASHAQYENPCGKKIGGIGKLGENNCG